MIHWLALRIAEYCVDGTDTDKEIVAYGLECRISDILQVAVLAALGLAFRSLTEIFCFSLCFTSLKRQVGGYHCATHLTCISLFSISAITVSKLAGYVPAGPAVWITLVGMAIVLGIVIRRAPLAHPNHPKSQAAHQKSRRASIRLATLGIVLLPLVAVRFPAHGMSGVFGGLFAAVSLLIPVKKRKDEDQ